MISPFLDLSGDSIPLEQVLGSGSTAVVVLRDGMAIKTPLRYHWSSDIEIKMNIRVIQREQHVYRRFQSSKCSGIVNCLGFSKEAIQLAHMKNGDLLTYLATKRPPRQLQLAWFRDMARTLQYIHDRRVLVADIASRNFLLDSDMTIKYCDFSEASLLPLDADMDTLDDNGYTTRIDLGLLGAVMYEVVTGKECNINLYKDKFSTDGRATWPRRDCLPSTENVWLGSIIENCWVDGGFRSALGLLQALESATSHPTVPRCLKEQRLLMTGGTFIDNFVDERSAVTLVVILGALSTLALYIGRKSL